MFGQFSMQTHADGTAIMHLRPHGVAGDNPMQEDPPDMAIPQVDELQLVAQDVPMAVDTPGMTVPQLGDIQELCSSGFVVDASRLPLTAAQFKIACRNIQVRMGLTVGPTGGWSEAAGEKLKELLQTCKRPRAKKGEGGVMLALPAPPLLALPAPGADGPNEAIFEDDVDTPDMAVPPLEDMEVSVKSGSDVPQLDDVEASVTSGSSDSDNDSDSSKASSPPSPTSPSPSISPPPSPVPASPYPEPISPESMRKLVEQLKQEKQELFSRLEEVETHLGSTDEWARETTEENTKLKIENAELKAAMNKLKAQGLLGYGQGPE
jgi:hypothetical protein